MKFIKAFRDLTISPKRTILVVFALVLGIWGVGTVLVSYVILTKDLNANYQSTTPTQVIFHSEKFDQLDLAQFNKRPEVETSELRDFSIHRIEVYPNVWIPLWLYGVESFDKFNLARVFYENGSKTPEPGSILIERDCKRVSNLKIGSIPRVRVGGKIENIKVSGICFDPAQAPATQDAFVYSYTDKKTYSQITGMPSNQRLIVRLRNVHSADDVKNVSEILKKDFNAKGISITSIEVPRFNEHPHQWQLNTLLFLIGTIGFLAFIMGAVLVSQLMRSIMANQVRQIGILKAVGGSQFKIFQIYIAMLLLMGLTSGLIAVPLSVLSGNAFSYFVAGKLNFNILTTSLPISIYIYLIAASLFLPLILSISILYKGTKISVKKALSDYGITQNIYSREYKLLKKLTGSNTFILAIRNSLRNSKRLTVTILSMAFGVAIFSTGFNVRQSLWNLLSGLKNEMRYDVQVVLNAPISKEDALKNFKYLNNVTKAETWVGGRGELQSKVVSTEKGAGIIALPRNSELLKLRIRDGRWLLPTNDFEVVLNQQASETYKNPKIGSFIKMTVGNKSVNAKVVGITEQFERPKIYVDIKQYDSIFNPDHLVNSIIFVAKDNEYKKVIALKKDIEKAIAGSDLKVLYVMSQAERVKIIYDHLNIILTTVVFLSLLVLIVSAVGMASATGINIWERTREIGVMRAIGATPKKIYSLFVMEGMIISVMSIVIGLILAYPLSQLAAIFFGQLMLGKEAILEYAFSPLGFGITLAVTIIFGWLASRIPARSAVEIPTHKALSYE
ncbi:MAG: FtsX-like permease family protein [Bacteroidetes bacterium]|nr:FtsX-like permease family protein [Bacteroidota bacterium]